ncbi:glutaredoxin family protein [bacterium]|nr:glutaredoxin family protein [bacterium]
MELKRVEGKNKGSIILFALSTCGWCKKTKNLLAELEVAYSYIDVDLLTGQSREQAIEELEKWNPRRSFPTLVINNQKSIVGFREDEIKEVLGYE